MSKSGDGCDNMEKSKNRKHCVTNRMVLFVGSTMHCFSFRKSFIRTAISAIIVLTKAYLKPKQCIVYLTNPIRKTVFSISLFSTHTHTHTYIITCKKKKHI